jgi:hypothetical protein
MCVFKYGEYKRWDEYNMHKKDCKHNQQAVRKNRDGIKPVSVYKIKRLPVFKVYLGLTQKAALLLFECFAKQNLPQTLTKVL